MPIILLLLLVLVPCVIAAPVFIGIVLLAQERGKAGAELSAAGCTRRVCVLSL